MENPLCQLVLENLKQVGNPFGYPREWRSYNRFRPAYRRPRTLLFSGCYGTLINPRATRAAEELLAWLGYSYTTLLEKEYCCGAPALACGEEETVRRLANHLLECCKEEGVKRVVTACARCYRVLAHIYPQILPNWRLEVSYLPDLLLRAVKTRHFELLWRPPSTVLVANLPEPPPVPTERLLRMLGLRRRIATIAVDQHLCSLRYREPSTAFQHAKRVLDAAASYEAVSIVIPCEACKAVVQEVGTVYMPVPVFNAVEFVRDLVLGVPEG